MNMYKIISLIALILMVFCLNASAGEQKVGLFINEKGAVQGYNLFPPKTTTTFLIDMEGRLVHTWESKYLAEQSVYLLENGLLLRPASLRGAVPNRKGGGKIELLDWDSNVVWSFDYYSEKYIPHHDVEPLPNGNVLVLAYEFKTKEEAIAAGRNPKQLDSSEEVWPEKVVEIQKTGKDSGKVVWEWRIWDHLIQDFDKTKPNYGVVNEHPELIDVNMGRRKADWLHANSVAYNTERDEIIISVRGISEIYVIDHSTTAEEVVTHAGGKSGMGGDILFRWGNPASYKCGDAEDMMLDGQHDAHWVSPGLPGAGNIMLFSNGVKRGYASADEIIPPLDKNGRYIRPAKGKAFGPPKQAWTYTAPEKKDFFSTAVSGVQRLPNGNTLICSGSPGIFFEVTSKGKIVWKYISPVTKGGDIIAMETDPLETNTVFRCTRILPDYAGLKNRDLTPMGTFHEVYPDKIITKVVANKGGKKGGKKGRNKGGKK
jgi:hypothetical protein